MTGKVTKEQLENMDIDDILDMDFDDIQEAEGLRAVVPGIYRIRSGKFNMNREGAKVEFILELGLGTFIEAPATGEALEEFAARRFEEDSQIQEDYSSAEEYFEHLETLVGADTAPTKTFKFKYDMKKPFNVGMFKKVTMALGYEGKLVDFGDWFNDVVATDKIPSETVFATITNRVGTGQMAGKTFNQLEELAEGSLDAE